MTSATDILRERAAHHDRVAQMADDEGDLSLGGIELHKAAEWRAVAELMEACTEIDEEYGLWCRLCNAISTHDADCKLAAMERAIEEREQ